MRSPLATWVGPLYDEKVPVTGEPVTSVWVSVGAGW